VIAVATTETARQNAILAKVMVADFAEQVGGVYFGTRILRSIGVLGALNGMLVKRAVITTAVTTVRAVQVYGVNHVSGNVLHSVIKTGSIYARVALLRRFIRMLRLEMIGIAMFIFFLSMMRGEN